MAKRIQSVKADRSVPVIGRKSGYKGIQKGKNLNSEILRPPSLPSAFLILVDQKVMVKGLDYHISSGDIIWTGDGVKPYSEVVIIDLSTGNTVWKWCENLGDLDDVPDPTE